jgi:teichuronic acid biosynthesis glycosyltransferase TuaC
MYPNSIRPYSGGFVHDHVQSLRQAGVEVDVSFTNPKLSRAQYLAALPALKRALSKPYDLIHVQHTYCMFQLQLVRPITKSNPPVVLTCHEGELGVPAKNRDSTAAPVKRLIYSSKLKHRAVAAADEVVVVNDQIREQLQLGRKCWVIPPATDTSRFEPMDQRQARREIGIDEGTQIVLFPSDAARKSYAKGYDLFRKAIRSFDGSVEIIAGGDIPPALMPLYMNAADVVVQTSRYEGSPMVVKEAMACCRPIVSTDVGDVRWLLGNLRGHHIVTSEPNAIADGICQALQFHDRTGGRSRLEELGLTLERTARRYLEVYERAIQAVHAA